MARRRLIIGRESPVKYHIISPDHKGFYNTSDSFLHSVRGHRQATLGALLFRL